MAQAKAGEQLILSLGFPVSFSNTTIFLGGGPGLEEDKEKAQETNAST